MALARSRVSSAAPRWRGVATALTRFATTMVNGSLTAGDHPWAVAMTTTVTAARPAKEAPVDVRRILWNVVAPASRVGLKDRGVVLAMYAEASLSNASSVTQLSRMRGSARIAVRRPSSVVTSRHLAGTRTCSAIVLLGKAVRVSTPIEVSAEARETDWHDVQ
jgi:hypothetical protein